MNSSGIFDYFSVIITSDGAGASKPNPKIYRDAIEKVVITLRKLLLLEMIM